MQALVFVILGWRPNRLMASSITLD